MNRLAAFIYSAKNAGLEHAKTFSLNQWVNVYHFWRRGAHA